LKRVENHLHKIKKSLLLGTSCKAYSALIAGCVKQEEVKNT